jgi:hypothetical protein
MSHKPIIELIGQDVLVAELSLKADTVRKWYERDGIPSKHWIGVTKVAKAKRLKVSLEMLAETQ